MHFFRTCCLRMIPLASALLISVGCHPASPEKPNSVAPLPTVTFAPVQTLEMAEHEELTGRIDAMEMVEIRPRVSGYITEVRFQSGQKVQKGDILFVIDQRPFRAALRKAEADLNQAKVRADLALREANRTSGLLESKAVSTEEADQRRSAAAESQAALISAEASVSHTRLNIEYSEIRSPIAGRVSRAMVTPGNNVSGVDGFTTLLTTVVSIDPVYAYADLDESAYLRFSRMTRENLLTTNSQGQIEMQMALGDDVGFPHIGFLESLDNRLDPSLGSIVLRAIFPNPTGSLTPGLFARLRIPVSARQPVLLVHESAISTEQNLKFVYTLSPSNTVNKQFVTLGSSIDGKRVVKSGLNSGDQIIVNGIVRIMMPGIAVNAQPEAPVSSPTAPRPTAVAN